MSRREAVECNDLARVGDDADFCAADGKHTDADSACGVRVSLGAWCAPDNALDYLCDYAEL